MKVKVVYWKGNGESYRDEAIVRAEEEEFETDSDYPEDEKILNDMWVKYNRGDRPDGRLRTSMSIGDIVSVDGRAYVCRSCGWERL